MLKMLYRVSHKTLGSSLLLTIVFWNTLYMILFFCFLYICLNIFCVFIIAISWYEWSWLSSRIAKQMASAACLLLFQKTEPPNKIEQITLFIFI